MSQFVAFTEEQFHDLDGKLSELGGYLLVACDDVSYQLLSRAEIQGVMAVRQSPLDFFESGAWKKNNVRLVWLANMKIEIATPQFVGTPDGSNFVLSFYARGIQSTVGGDAVVNEWTVD